MNLLNQYPVDLEVVYPEQSSRLLALLGILMFPKWLLLIPHIIILSFLSMLSGVVAWLAFWAILFTGTYPRSFFNFTVGVQRWSMRTNAWFFGWSDKYPPFSLD